MSAPIPDQIAVSAPIPDRKVRDGPRKACFRAFASLRSHAYRPAARIELQFCRVSVRCRSIPRTFQNKAHTQHLTCGVRLTLDRRQERLRHQHGRYLESDVCGCVSSHSARAVTLGSTPALLHHAASSPQRWTSRWCPRHNGTVNSSLTLRPSARLCMNRRWWASEGRRPRIRQDSWPLI